VGFATVQFGEVESVSVGVKKLLSIRRPSAVVTGYADQLARESGRQGHAPKWIFRLRAYERLD
jgi:hypothetical protein